MPKLIDGLKKLSKSDPLVICTTEDNGQNVIAGCGELHVEICLKDLEEDYANCPLVKSEPIVTFKETVTEMSSKECMSKSPNKHNRVHAKAEPLDEEVSIAIEKGKISAKDEPKIRAKYMFEEHGWDKELAGTKLWDFGPENVGPNLLVDATKGIQFMNEIRDSCMSAW